MPDVGILASAIASQTASGDNGPGLLYDDSQQAGNAGKQLRLRVTAWPSAGTLFVRENGAFDFTGAPDGAYTVGYSVYADNMLAFADVATITIGNINANAPGATLQGSSSLQPGAATGQKTASAPGAILNGSSFVQPGAASSQQNNAAPGVALQGVGTLQPGAATGGQSGDASAPGANLQGVDALQPGTAVGQQGAGAPGASLDGSASLQPGTAVGDYGATAPGTVLSGGGSLQAGFATNGSGATSAYLLTPSCSRLSKLIARRTMSEFYLPGEMVRIAVRIVDAAGLVVDPGVLTLKTRLGAGAISTHVFGVGPDIVRDGVGMYYADLALPAAGVFAYRWESGPQYAGAAEGAINVQKSRFI